MARLTDGHPTKVEFLLDTTVAIYEVSVTPPGIDGGGANDTTTMRNVTWRTQQPKKLKTLTPFSFTAQYNTNVYNTLLALVNQIDQIRVTFSDGAVLLFYGWLNSFIPQAVSEGQPPLATVEVIPSNQTALGVEVGPTLTGG